MSEASPTSRALLVAAADEERRRIERALHDGVQQDLIAVSVRLQLARRLAATDVPAALTLLEELMGDVRGALDRIRALADEIYPSLLEGRGLVEAFRGAASATGPTVTVLAPEVGRYPARVEEAAFFCGRAVLDAVAADASVTIRIGEEDGALRLTVQSDQAAEGAVRARLVLPRERIEALGGSVRLEPDGSGVRLSAAVPLA